MVARERAVYQHGENNDIDLDALVRSLCLISVCVFRDPMPFDAMQVASAKAAGEGRKLNDATKRAYFEPAASRKRFGFAQVQRGPQLLASAAGSLGDALSVRRVRASESCVRAHRRLATAVRRRLAVDAARLCAPRVEQRRAL